MQGLDMFAPQPPEQNVRLDTRCRTGSRPGELPAPPLGQPRQDSRAPAPEPRAERMSGKRTPHGIKGKPVDGAAAPVPLRPGLRAKESDPGGRNGMNHRMGARKLGLPPVEESACHRHVVDATWGKADDGLLFVYNRNHGQNSFSLGGAQRRNNMMRGSTGTRKDGGYSAGRSGALYCSM